MSADQVPDSHPASNYGCKCDPTLERGVGLESPSVGVSEDDIQRGLRTLGDPFLPQLFTLEDFRAAFDRANAGAVPSAAYNTDRYVAGGAALGPNRAVGMLQASRQTTSDALSQAKAFEKAIADCGEALRADRQCIGDDDQIDNRKDEFAQVGSLRYKLRKAQQLDGIDRLEATLRDLRKESDTPELPQSALDVQVGGAHYKECAIQPIEYICRNNLGFLEGCIVKRITRWRSKDGIQDLQKIKHECDLLIEMETQKVKAATYGA